MTIINFPTKEDKLWNVHIFPVMRVKVTNIKAENQMDAVKEAESFFLRNQSSLLGESEYAEDIAYYLIDEVGDEDFKNSIWIDKAEYEKKGK